MKSVQMPNLQSELHKVKEIIHQLQVTLQLKNEALELAYEVIEELEKVKKSIS